MDASNGDYGLWTLVAINSIFFILFAASYFKPQSKQDWRTLGMFSAFVVALFTEMYGFPLTIYLLSGWLSEHFPGINWLSHDAGHLPEMIFGWKANPHFGPFHLLSSLFILGGFWLLADALASALCRPENADTGVDWPLRPNPPPPVRRLHSHHDRLPAAVADPGHAHPVSYLAYDLHPPGETGRKTGTGSIRRGIPRLPAQNARVVAKVG